MENMGEIIENFKDFRRRPNLILFGDANSGKHPSLIIV